MTVIASAKRDIEARAEIVFELATGIGDAPYVFAGWGPFPRVARVEILGGGRMTVGSTRRVFFEDGTHLDEDVVVFRPAAEWAGVVRHVPGRFSWLVRGVRSHWTFHQRDGATTAQWNCVFEPASSAVRPLVSMVAQLLFASMMRRALRSMDRLVRERGQWTGG